MNAQQFEKFIKTLWVFIILIVIVLIISKFIPHGPNVVVYMDKDAAPLQTISTNDIPVKILTNEKAVLWWTVYKYSIDKHLEESAARYNADESIETVYGK